MAYTLPDFNLIGLNAYKHMTMLKTIYFRLILDNRLYKAMLINSGVLQK